MLTCRICGCLCDPADTINGVCDDCRYEMQYKEEKREEAELLMSEEFQQMVIEDIIFGQMSN